MPDMAARAEAALNLYHTNVKPLWNLDALSADDHRVLLTAVTELGTGLRTNMRGIRLPSIPGQDVWLLWAVSQAVTPATVDAALTPHEPRRAPSAFLYDAAGQRIPFVTGNTRYPARSKCAICGRDIFRHEYGLSGWSSHEAEPAPVTMVETGTPDDGRTVQQDVIEAILRLLDGRDVLTIVEDAGGTQMHAILYVDTFPVPIWVAPDGLAAVPLGLDPDGRVIRAARAALTGQEDPS